MVQIFGKKKENQTIAVHYDLGIMAPFTIQENGNIFYSLKCTVQKRIWN